MTPAVRGIVYSSIAGLATSIGAVPFLFWKKGIDRRSLDVLLGFAAGIMLAATAFSLVVPSIEIGGPYRFVVGFILGAIFVDLMDKFSPHEHFIKGYEEPVTKSRLSKIWLFVIAITLHNFPEGMAVGVGGFTKEAVAIAMAIGIQNIPEGAAVAGSLIGAGYSVRRSFWVTFLTGAVEIIGGALGAFLITLSQPLLPYAMAFAGGAMLYVIGDEIMPELTVGDMKGSQRMHFLLGLS